MPILYTKKYLQEGDLAHEYNPLLNRVDKTTNADTNIELNEISNFTTDEIITDLKNPINIECQPSYDGTVNLIINDDVNPPRIINSRFSKIENNRYRIINRNQSHQTNLYRDGQIDQQTRLFRNINKIPRIVFNGVSSFGQLKGGNYTFYIKYGDNDYNRTDIVAESGQISIFKGNLGDVFSISGTLQDERTDKTISLTILNIDTTFSNIFLYFSRETSDINGFRITEFGKFSSSYPIGGDWLNITINGFEETEMIDGEELNIKYNLVTAVKTQTQVQNMLFFGNIQGVNVDVRNLQNLLLFVQVGLHQSDQSIGYIDHDHKQKDTDDFHFTEYYNPLNTYYKLGYWPGEIYRLGAVCIMTDDSLSPVFNLRGCEFTEDKEWNFEYDIDSENSYDRLLDKLGNIQYIPQNDFLYNDYEDNTKGVFMIRENISPHDYEKKEIHPIGFKIKIPDDIKVKLKEYKVKGLFIVRQKRIPITLCQGLTVGVDNRSNIPMIYDPIKRMFITESFINHNRILDTSFNQRIREVSQKQCGGFLSVDVSVNPQLQSQFDGSKFTIQKVYSLKSLTQFPQRRYYYNEYEYSHYPEIRQSNAIFIDSDVPLKFINNLYYSTRVGNAEDKRQFGQLWSRDLSATATNLVRGIYCPFIGLLDNIDVASIYNIRIKNYDSTFKREYFNIRSSDNSPFFAISDRYELNDPILADIFEVYRGDCFTSTTTIRINRNFTDPDVPFNDIIMLPNAWQENYKGLDATTAEDWDKINRSDLNSVPLGMWITFKCLSNYNVGLRSVDHNHPDEMAIMGNPRQFYPAADIDVKASSKIPESWLLNDGYNATVGRKRNLTAPNVPYIKDLFDNRVMFSNVQIDDDFRNAYRIFQGLSYKDIDRQYGAIVKLIDWGVNLFCVFEHGLALIPINEKALMSTNTGQSIHMYGAGVIQNQVSLISPDYGSIWPESIIKTPTGIYGVDTYAKKIWKFSNEKGFELISDMKVQSFLNENIKLAEKDKYPIIALKNVKSHFNNYKGDVMFTFYNYNEKDSEWHLCYNERLDKWITRYSWTPLCSENINNIFYSLDKKRAEIFAHIFSNLNTRSGLRTALYIQKANLWSILNIPLENLIYMAGYDFYDHFDFAVESIKSSYMIKGNDEYDTEATVEIPISIPVEKNYVQFDNSIIFIKKDLLLTPDIKDNTYRHFFYNSYTEEVQLDPSSENITNVRTWEPLINPTNSSLLFPLINGFYRIDRSLLTDELWYKPMKFTGTDPNDYTHYGAPEEAFNKYTFFENWINSTKLWIDPNILNYEDKEGIIHQLYYLKIEVTITPSVLTNGAWVYGSKFRQIIGIVVDFDVLNSQQEKEYDKLLLNGFYVHGRAGIFDEINYTDKYETNEILPTKWYDKQEPFEFEFVVNNMTGLHKIYNDLIIISNNVAPESFEFSIIGDVYGFNKRGIHRYLTFGEDEWLHSPKVSQDFYTGEPFDEWTPSGMENQNSGTKVTRDQTTKEYYLVTNQLAKDIKNPDFGRRRGNMSYKEDSWYITIEPIRFKSKYKESKNEISVDKEWNSTRIRDKFLKVRVRYDGTQLALITALKTLMTVSYS